MSRRPPANNRSLSNPQRGRQRPVQGQQGLQPPSQYPGVPSGHTGHFQVQMDTSEDIPAPQTMQPATIQVHLALTTPRPVTEDEQAADKIVMEEIGHSLIQQQPLSDRAIGRLLATVVTEFPQHLDNRYENIRIATELVTTNPAVRQTLLDGLKRSNFTETRRLVILQNQTAEPPAITTLRTDYSTLYELLTIEVAHYNQWTKDDITNNNGIMHGSNSTVVPPGIRTFEGQLRSLRPHPSNENSADFRLAKSQYKDEFKTVFSESNVIDPTTGRSPTDAREYLAFYVLNRSFLLDTIKAIEDSSSNFKTAEFCHFFVYIPFLYIPTELEFKQDLSWRIYIILHSTTQNNHSKYRAKSDFFLMNSFLCPLVISEVISQKNQSDENRMLLQGIAAVRLGQHFMKTGKEFFLVAIYVTGDFTVRRYILMYEERTKKIHIVQKKFDLQNSGGAHAFFLEMLNLRDKVTELSKNFDKQFETKLSEFTRVAKDLPSLYSRSHDSRPASRGHSNDNDNDPNRNQNQNLSPDQFRVGLADPPLNEEDVNEDTYGAFHAYNVRNALDKLGYKMLYISFFNPNVAVVFPKGDPETIHFAKFIPDYSKELKIIKYLNSVTSSFNNVIRSIGSTTISVSEGSVMVMASVGKPFTKVDNASMHLPGLLLQLLEGVQFLHVNRVAHLDLKPENILVGPTQANNEQPKLTIIDFSCAVRVDSHASCINVVRGTDGYMAPEIGSRPYNPFKADLWSFGVVLMRLCQECIEFPGRSVVLDVAGQLMQVNADKRPALSEILRQMRNLGHKENDVPRKSHLQSLPDRTVSVF